MYFLLPGPGTDDGYTATLMYGDEVYESLESSADGILSKPADPEVGDERVFLGWCTDKSDISSLFDFSTRITDDLVLHAFVARTTEFFDPDKQSFIVQFVYGDTGIPSDYACYNEGEFVSPPDLQNPQGFVFKGWYTDVAFTTPFLSALPVTKEMVLYAKFVVSEYVATFVAGNTVVASVPYTTDSIVIEEPDVPEKIGYIGKWENYSLDGDITIRAEYVLRTYSVNFYNEGDLYQMRSYTVENPTFDVPHVPEKQGYDGKWSHFEVSTTNPVDLDVYSEYVPHVYSVTLNPNSGTLNNQAAPLEFECTYGEEFVLESYVPLHPSYKFSYWYMDSPDNAYTSIRVTEDVIFYAKWVSAESYVGLEPVILYDGEPVYLATFHEGGVVYTCYIIGFVENVMLDRLSNVVTSGPNVDYNHQRSTTSSERVVEHISKTISSSTTITTNDASGVSSALDLIGSAMGFVGTIVTPACPVLGPAMELIGAGTSFLGTVAENFGSETVTTESCKQSWSTTKELFNSLTITDSSTIEFTKENSQYGKKYAYYLYGDVEYIQIEKYDYNGNYLGSEIISNVSSYSYDWAEVREQGTFVTKKVISESTVKTDNGIFLEHMKEKADGSSEHPIPITSVSELKGIGNKTPLYANYTLWADLNLFGTTWIPIGYSSSTGLCTPFTGTFEGNGHKISNMRMVVEYVNSLPYSANTSNGTYTYVSYGLFAYTKGAVISSLEMDNAIIELTGDSNKSHYYSIGVVVGSAYNTTIEDIQVNSGHIYTKKGCKGHNASGGIAGVLDTTDSSENGRKSTIKNCVVEGDFFIASSGIKAYVGGIVGDFKGYGSKISYCVNDAGTNLSKEYSENVYCGEDGYGINVIWSNSRGFAGGIVGSACGQDLLVEYCVSASYINSNANGHGKSNRFVGGIVGAVRVNDALDSFIVTVSDCIYSPGMLFIKGSDSESDRPCYKSFMMGDMVLKDKSGAYPIIGKYHLDEKGVNGKIHHLNIDSMFDNADESELNIVLDEGRYYLDFTRVRL